MFGVDASEGRYTRRVRFPPDDDVTCHSSRPGDSKISTETVERDVLDEHNTINSCGLASLALLLREFVTTSTDESLTR